MEYGRVGDELEAHFLVDTNKELCEIFLVRAELYVAGAYSVEGGGVVRCSFENFFNLQ